MLVLQAPAQLHTSGSCHQQAYATPARSPHQHVVCGSLLCGVGACLLLPLCCQPQLLQGLVSLAQQQLNARPLYTHVQAISLLCG